MGKLIIRVKCCVSLESVSMSRNYRMYPTRINTGKICIYMLNVLFNCKKK